MGNRAYITIRQKTYYVHWNGGLDTWCPFIEAIQETAKDFGFPSNEEIQAAFVAFCGSKMEECTNATPYEMRQWTEENGHYFLDFPGNNFLKAVHRFERHNEATDMDDVLSVPINDPRAYFMMNGLAMLREDFWETAKNEYPERVEIFTRILRESGERRKSEADQRRARIAVDSKKTFKKLILDDLKAQGLDHIAKKIKSIKYKSFSGGDSVDVSAVDLFKSEREALNSLLKEYQDGHFDGMTDSYEYRGSSKARSAKYVYYQTEFSQELKDLAERYLLDEYGIQKGDNTRAKEVLNRWYDDSVRHILWEAESVEDLKSSGLDQAGAQ